MEEAVGGESRRGLRRTHWARQVVAWLIEKLWGGGVPPGDGALVDRWSILRYQQHKFDEGA
jgi:hypothetical protein